jgi:hypothetical protein
MNHRGDKSGNRRPRSPRRARPVGAQGSQLHPPPTPLQPPTGSPRRSSRFPATPRHQRPRSPRRACPVGAQGSQLPQATNTPAAPDGLAPSELKVPSYPPPPTPLQPPTGSPRRSSRFAATPRHQHPGSPRRARPVGAQGSQLLHTTNATTAPDGLAPSELQVRSYPPPPTPPQPPTGSPRRS